MRLAHAHLFVIQIVFVPRPGVVGRVPAFQPGPGTTSGRVRNFFYYPGTGFVSSVCVISCVVSGIDPDILLTTISGKPALVFIQDGWEISVIIVTDDYLCCKEPESPFNFFLILIFNELFKFKTTDERQH